MRNWIVTLALLAVGCDRYTAPEACEDVADAAGEMAARCFPGDPTAYDTMHEAVLEVVDGDCDNVVDVRNVDKVFKRGSEEIHVLSGLDLDIPEGEFLALMGPSGSGKSTLLNLVGGLDRPTKGTVEVTVTAKAGPTVEMTGSITLEVR